MKVRARTYALALGIATLTIGASTPHALAQALQSYVLENVKTFSPDKETEVLIPRIEVTGANIGRADLERMLTSEQSSSARADMMLNLQAQRIVVPQLIVTRTGKDKGRFVLRDYLVTNLDRARFERISLGGFDGAGTTEDKGEAKLTSGQITLEGGDFSKVAAAAKAGDATDAVGKLRVFSWSGFEVSVADKDIPASAPGGNTLRFGLKSAKANTDYNGDIPTKALASFEGMYFVGERRLTRGMQVLTTALTRGRRGRRCRRAEARRPCRRGSHRSHAASARTPCIECLGKRGGARFLIEFVTLEQSTPGARACAAAARVGTAAHLDSACGAEAPAAADGARDDAPAATPYVDSPRTQENTRLRRPAAAAASGRRTVGTPLTYRVRERRRVGRLVKFALE